ncbi:hypothetical protein RvY_07943 [Ramazzottius varieornatus]|uniref:Uncharacterized protein n=1 Tax=Ramazzottius varieornatus TaxID=947166 RepID=A0A1D1VDC8_RAMVA|nr:hypothetical protein RvY_07943 [Ramazzottius varieornatus]
MSELELLEGPVKGGRFSMEELRQKIAAESSSEVHTRCGSGLPTVIGFEIFSVTDNNCRRHDQLGWLELRDMYWGRTSAVAAGRKVSSETDSKNFNGAEGPYNQCIDLVYKEYDLMSSGFEDEEDEETGDDDDNSRKGNKSFWTKEELRLVRNGRQTIGELRLGLGDVAVDFEEKDNRVTQMFLLFGDGTGKPCSGSNRYDSRKSKVFYLGRLTDGQGFLDKWDADPYGVYSCCNIVYDVSYDKKSLDVPSCGGR